jgi:hypothetical protein
MRCPRLPNKDVHDIARRTADSIAALLRASGRYIDA